MALSMAGARAYPDGAPWGAANPAAEQNCASCHFDGAPIHDSEVLAIDGLPQQIAARETYELEITFSDPEATIAGFQLIAQAADQHAGTFVSSGASVEFVGAAIRSTVPIRNNDGISWPVEWRTSDVTSSPVVLYVAVTAANDDGSPFGDTIHFRSYKLEPE